MSNSNSYRILGSSKVVASKGSYRIVIPADARKKFSPGSHVVYVETPEGLILITKLDEVKKLLNKKEGEKG